MGFQKDNLLNLSTFRCRHGEYILRNCSPFSFTRAILFLNFPKPALKPGFTRHPLRGGAHGDPAGALGDPVGALGDPAGALGDPVA